MTETAFIYVLNMSMAATMVFMIVMFIRLILKNKLPKLFSYVLWSIVLIRLIVPFSFSTTFSIFNYMPAPAASRTLEMNGSIGSLKYIPDNISQMRQPEIETGFNSIDKRINKSLPSATPESSVDPMQVIMFAGSSLWILGVVVMLSFLTFSYIKTISRLKTATIYKNDEIIEFCVKNLGLNRNINIYISDQVNTPIVCGLINPRIILPINYTDNVNELKHIILHELVHIKRLDYIIKPLSLLVLSIHWFNPVVWISFILCHKDMELSCDEKVIASFDKDIRKEYAYSLLNMSIKQNNLFNGGFLAFGEKNIEGRIKSIVDYKKPVFVVRLAGAIVLVVLSISLLANPIDDGLNLGFLNKDKDFRHAFRHLEQPESIVVNNKYTISYRVDLMKLLEVDKWKGKKARSPLELSSEIKLDINGKLAVRFYDTEPLAMVIYDGDYRYYKIPDKVYETIEKYVITHRRKEDNGPVETYEP